MAETRNRFSHLLKPIGDLAANWDVDVAKDLEDYLEELAGLDLSASVTQTGLATPADDLNFAEAALLIQGSTAVYSKKVEHLYTLVNETLRLVCESRESRNSKVPDENSPNEQESAKHPSEFEFLPLDDIAPAGNQTINLRETGAGATANIPNSRSQKRQKPLVEPSIHENAKLAHTMAEIPIALLPPAAFGCGESADHSSNAVTFRIDNARLQPDSGALLLDETDMNIDLLDHINQETGDSLEETDILGVASPPPPADFEDNGAYEEMDQDDDDLVNDEADAAPVTPGDAPQIDIRTAGTNSEMQLEQVVEETVPLPDPWEQLDPHSQTNIRQRPFKLGRPFGRVGKQRVCDENISFEGFVNKLNAPLPVVARRRKLFFPEFEYGYTVMRRRRLEQAAEAAMRGRTQLEATEIELNEQERVEEEEDDGFTFDAVDEDQAGEEEDYEWPAAQINFSDAVDPGSTVPMATGHCLERHGNNHRFEVNELAASYEQACQRYMDESAKMWEKYVLDEELVRRVTCWTQKIEPFLVKETERAPFDIHVYSDRVVERFCQADAGSVRTLGDLTESESKFEVCRAFLAALQLAVNGDVSFADSEGISNPEVKLVSQRRRDLMQGFVAPSLRDELSRQDTQAEEAGQELRNHLADNPFISPTREGFRPKRRRQYISISPGISSGQGPLT